MSLKLPDPITVIANIPVAWGGDVPTRMMLDRHDAEVVVNALTKAGLRVVPIPPPVAGVSAHQWTDEYKPTAPASMSPRQAALEILAELDWQTVIEGLSMHEDMDPLAYYGLRAELSDRRWLDSRDFMGSTLRSHLSAWATSRMALKSWCLNEDHHDGDMIWFNDCQYGGDADSPCEWGYCWALDGDPEEFLALAMDLLREGWEPEEVVPVVDDATRQEVDEDALNEDLDSLEDWESALRSTIRNQVTAGFNVTAQGDLADLLVRAHRWIAAAYLGRTD